MKKDKVISVTVDEAIAILNRAVASDVDALDKLVEHRVPCKPTLADDPTIQVVRSLNEKDHTVGMLGIINGFFGVDEQEWGHIKAVFDYVCPNKCQPLVLDTLTNGKCVCHHCRAQVKYKLTKFAKTGEGTRSTREVTDLKDIVVPPKEGK